VLEPVPQEETRDMSKELWIEAHELAVEEILEANPGMRPTNQMPQPLVRTFCVETATQP
jgi:hypothetical protein